jgi:hypothetical protein
MKKIRLNWAKALMMVLVLGMIACGEDKDDPTDPDNSVPDPEGTLTYTLINITFGGEENPLMFGNSISSCSIILTNSMNLKTNGGVIVPVGKVSGLGNITKIPAGSVWSSQEAGASIYQGYIIRAPGDVYYRVFISDWRDEYGVTWNGATYTRFYCTVKYQGPFTPAP